MAGGAAPTANASADATAASIGRARVSPRLLQIQARLFRCFERQIDVGLPVAGPGGLSGQHRFQHMLVFALAFGGLQQGHHMVRSGMERRIPQDQTDIVRVLFHQVLDDGIERSAPFAGRVEKLDDVHLGIGRPDRGRTEARQGR